MIGQLLCSIGLHKWSMWSEPYRVALGSLHWYQNRMCARCKIVKRRHDTCLGRRR